MSLPSLTASFTNSGSAALGVETSGRKHTAAASIRIRRFELHRANELPLVFTLVGTIPAPPPRRRIVTQGQVGKPTCRTRERKTMNGSTEKRKPPIVLHGVGLQAGASACRRRAGKRNRRYATVAAHWRMRPAARGPANQFSACRENWIDSSHARGNGNSHAIHSHGKNEHSPYDVVQCARGIA